MRDKVTLSEKCIELARRVGGDEDEPAASDGSGGFSMVVQLATNILRIGAEETYRSLWTRIEQIRESTLPSTSTATMSPTTRRCPYMLLGGQVKKPLRVEGTRPPLGFAGAPVVDARPALS